MILYSVGRASHDPFNIFSKVETAMSPDQLKPGGALLLHGGEDISPSIYNHKVSNFCHAGDKPSKRDQFEIDMANRAIDLEMPIIGICRGAQLVCALDGGYLVQHIVGHGYDGHIVINPENGQRLGKSNTAHHQMMMPRKSKTNLILGIVNEIITGFEQDDKLRSYEGAIELVHFKKINALGIQGHPEWMQPSDEYVANIARYIKEEML